MLNNFIDYCREFVQTRQVSRGEEALEEDEDLPGSG